MEGGDSYSYPDTAPVRVGFAPSKRERGGGVESRSVTKVKVKGRGIESKRKTGQSDAMRCGDGSDRGPEQGIESNQSGG
jgi:hypothetical protein